MRKVLTLFVLTVIYSPTNARANFDLKAVRATAPVQVDGKLDEAEWKGAARVEEFIQFEPYLGEPAQEKTEAFFLYDDTYIYFGFRCYDSEPSRIAA